MKEKDKETRPWWGWWYASWGYIYMEYSRFGFAISTSTTLSFMLSIRILMVNFHFYNRTAECRSLTCLLPALDNVIWKSSSNFRVWFMSFPGMNLFFSFFFIFMSVRGCFSGSIDLSIVLLDNKPKTKSTEIKWISLVQF